MLARAFAEREVATRRASASLLDWATSDSDEPIARPLTDLAEGYLEFLLAHPGFSRLILREELAGASALEEVPRTSKAIEEAFAAVRKVAKARGLRAFDVSDAVLVFVSLTYFPASQSSTFMATMARDLGDASTRRRHVDLVVAQLVGLVSRG